MNENSSRIIAKLEQSEEVVVIRDGIRVVFDNEGGIAVFGSAPVTLHALKIGDKMDDGTIYAGLSPDTDKPMYACSEDAPLTMQWWAAMEYAEGFEGHGKPKGTFRVPTGSELNVLFNNRAAIGGFNETGSYPGGRYWSSSQLYNRRAHGQSFSDEGYGRWQSKDDHSLVRLVRN